MRGIKVLASDTGGTIFDWHGGFIGALTDWDSAQGVEPDWHELASEYREPSGPISSRRRCGSRCHRRQSAMNHRATARQRRRAGR
jgi:hypothetical protein